MSGPAVKCIFASTLLIALIALSASAGEGHRSGKAVAEWLVPDAAASAGKTYNTVVRLQVDPHWHVYWHNPGDAGMETTAQMKMPDGWKASGLVHPTPKRFKAGGLDGFGHEGTVDYLLSFEVPRDFKGDAELQAELSWLTCNDLSCVAGEVTLKLKLRDGKAVGAMVDCAAVQKAVAGAPEKAAHEVKLRFAEASDKWTFTLESADALNLDAQKTEVFVATPELVPTAATIRFRKDGHHWVAQCAKSEFAPDAPEECVILLMQEGKRPVRVEWKGN